MARANTTQEEKEDLVPVINAGQIIIENFDPNGVSLNMEDKMVCIGEQFCVDITVADFVQIRELNFSVNWNPNVIEFDNFSNVAISTPTINTKPVKFW